MGYYVIVVQRAAFSMISVNKAIICGKISSNPVSMILTFGDVKISCVQLIIKTDDMNHIAMFFGVHKKIVEAARPDSYIYLEGVIGKSYIRVNAFTFLPEE